MRARSLRSRLALPVAMAGAIAWSIAAQAETPAAKPGTVAAAAAQACEREARQALTAKGSNGVEVTFAAAPAVQHNLSNDSQMVLKGVARWRLARDVRSISFSCNVDLASFEVGLVLRDTTAAVAAQAAPARAPAEPDLSQLSPAACESSAVEALKRRWPRVSEISFDPATRQFRQPSATLAELHGSGRAVPAPRSPSTFFGFDCEIDPRDGRVLRTSVSS
ncbi:MAG: hypothetical protein ACXWJA_11705 [Caldimonas sp.]